MKINTLWISLISAFCVVYSFVYFIQEIKKYSVPEDKQHLDAIVVLTGGPKRIDVGMHLLKERYANKLFISGIYNKLSHDDYIVKRKKFRSNKIILDTASTTTKENAENSRLWIVQKNIHSIYLVTEQFHLPRALLEFHRTVPHIHIIAWPVRHYNLYEELNDKNLKGLYLILYEYFKYYGALINIRLEAIFDKGL